MLFFVMTISNASWVVSGLLMLLPIVGERMLLVVCLCLCRIFLFADRGIALRLCDS